MSLSVRESASAPRRMEYEQSMFFKVANYLNEPAKRYTSVCLRRLYEQETFEGTYWALKNVKQLRIEPQGLAPIKDLTALIDFDQITHLYIANNQVRDLSPLRELKNLVHLDISGNPVIDISPLADLPNLKHLDLSRTAIDNSRDLANIKNLSVLLLSQNRIENLEFVASIENLKQLHLDENNISSIGPLKSLKDLRFLFLNNNRINDLSPLAELDNLQYLRLDYNEIENLMPLRNLEGLWELNLEGNRISDLSPLGEMKKFNGMLNLAKNKINNLEALKNLGRLNSVNSIRLDLSGNEGVDLRPLKNMKRITALRVANTGLHDFDPIPEFTQLKALDVSGNRLWRINGLEKLVHLNALNLASNRIKDIEPLLQLAATAKYKLSTVDLRNNPVEQRHGLMALEKKVWNLYLDQKVAQGLHQVRLDTSEKMKGEILENSPIIGAWKSAHIQGDWGRLWIGYEFTPKGFYYKTERYVDVAKNNRYRESGTWTMEENRIFLKCNEAKIVNQDNEQLLSGNENSLRFQFEIEDDKLVLIEEENESGLKEQRLEKPLELSKVRSF